MFAQETGKVWNLSLDTVVVKGNTFSRTVRNRADGSFVWDMQMMDFLPKIMGNAMGLYPAILLLSLSVWGALLGFIGLIIALPLTTLLMAYYQRYITREEDEMQEKTA